MAEHELPLSWHLPDTVLEVMGPLLDIGDLLAARTVDKRWKMALTPSVKTCKVIPHCWLTSPAQRSAKMVEAFPFVDTLVVCMDACRQPLPSLSNVIVEATTPFALGARHLTALTVVLRTKLLPNEGYPEPRFNEFILKWMQHAESLARGLNLALPAFAAKLRHLELNSMTNTLGRLAPALSTLTNLTSLKFQLSDHYTMNDDDLAVLQQLTNLQQLHIKAWLPVPLSVTFTKALSLLVGLRSLEVEAITLPPEECVVAPPTFVSSLTALTALRLKGVALRCMTGVGCLTAIEGPLTLTTETQLTQQQWKELAGLKSLQKLNINAYQGIAPSAESSNSQLPQSLEGISLGLGTQLAHLGLKLHSAQDLAVLSGLVGLQQLVVALDPHHRTQVPRLALLPLAALTVLTRFDMFDTAGQVHLTQGLMQDMASWWPLLQNFYFEGVISIHDFAFLHDPRNGAAIGGLLRLDQFDLMNTSTVPFKLNLGELPSRITTLGLQNAVVMVDSAAPTVHRVCRHLESSSILRGVTWAELHSGDLCTWLARCPRLTTLRLEVSLPWFADMMHDAELSPLAPLSGCCCLQYLDVMFADSGEATVGTLDQRLVADIARLPRLQELEIWTKAARDWNEDVSFLEIAHLPHLRQLRLEILPFVKCLVVRDTMHTLAPSCKLRLVSDAVEACI